MDLADALDGEVQQNPWPAQSNQQAGGQTWPGQPPNPAWPGQPGQPTWPGQQPGMPTSPFWPGPQPGQPNMPTLPVWPGPAPPTAPQNVPPLTIPFDMTMPSGAYDKMLITIQGEIKPNAKMFTINLGRNNDIAFHFNPRFNEGGRQVIVRNSMIGNSWGSEERAASYFPFAQGKPFELKILCTANEFKVAVNKSHLLEFRHRIRELNQIKTLSIYHDVTLASVNVETLS